MALVWKKWKNEDLPTSNDQTKKSTYFRLLFWDSVKKCIKRTFLSVRYSLGFSTIISLSEKGNCGGVWPLMRRPFSNGNFHNYVNYTDSRPISRVCTLHVITPGGADKISRQISHILTLREICWPLAILLELCLINAENLGGTNGWSSNRCLSLKGRKICEE